MMNIDEKNPQQILANQFNHTLKIYTLIKCDLSQGCKDGLISGSQSMQYCTLTN